MLFLVFLKAIDKLGIFFTPLFVYFFVSFFFGITMGRGRSLTEAEKANIVKESAKGSSPEAKFEYGMD